MSYRSIAPLPAMILARNVWIRAMRVAPVAPTAALREEVIGIGNHHRCSLRDGSLSAESGEAAFVDAAHAEAPPTEDPAPARPGVDPLAGA